ncbi:MAG TPA: hypothetical protein VGD35_15455 [Chitinophaga sp.]
MQLATFDLIIIVVYLLATIAIGKSWGPVPIKTQHGGYFLAPEGEERVGDVSNVVFSNGWIADDDGKVFIYYGSSDTRMHVAVSSIQRLVDYVMHSPADGGRSAETLNTIYRIINQNKQYLSHANPAYSLP